MNSPEAFWIVAMSFTAGMIVLGVEVRHPAVFRALQRFVEFLFFRKDGRRNRT